MFHGGHEYVWNKWIKGVNTSDQAEGSAAGSLVGDMLLQAVNGKHWRNTGSKIDVCKGK